MVWLHDHHDHNWPSLQLCGSVLWAWCQMTGGTCTWQGSKDLLDYWTRSSLEERNTQRCQIMPYFHNQVKWCRIKLQRVRPQSHHQRAVHEYILHPGRDEILLREFPSHISLQKASSDQQTKLLNCFPLGINNHDSNVLCPFLDILALTGC